MKTLLIPVDFTPTSRNAVHYAAGYCRQFDYQRVILLKTFYDTLFDEVVMSADYGVVSSDFRQREHEEAEAQLKALSQELSLANTEIEVTAITSELPLIRAITHAVRSEHPRAILLGSDTHAYDSDSYIGEHVIEIARVSPVNVVIVPAGQSFQEVKEIVVPVDSFSKASLAKINELSVSPYLRSMRWDILKTDAGQVEGEPSVEGEELKQLLGQTPHELFFSRESRTIDGVVNFIREHPVQLIVALPGKYSFLYRLTHRSISDAICRNTEKPVLILKQFRDN